MSEVNQTATPAPTTPCACSAPQGQPVATQPQPAGAPAAGAPKAGKRNKKR